MTKGPKHVGRARERARNRAPTRNLSTFGYVYVHKHE
jgi:hypothetical protein